MELLDYPWRKTPLSRLDTFVETFRESTKSPDAGNAFPVPVGSKVRSCVIAKALQNPRASEVPIPAGNRHGALAKQAIDRYPSAEQLGDDLKRHLTGEPVWARDVYWWRRLGVLLGRHRGMVIGTAAAIVAVLSGAVNLHLCALYYALGAAVLLLLWRAATDRELGRFWFGRGIRFRKCHAGGMEGAEVVASGWTV